MLLFVLTVSQEEWRGWSEFFAVVIPWRDSIHDSLVSSVLGIVHKNVEARSILVGL